MGERSKYFLEPVKKGDITNPIVRRILEGHKGGSHGAPAVVTSIDKNRYTPGNLQINGLWFKPISDQVNGPDGPEKIPGAPPQAITVSEESFVHKFETLRTAESAKINSGHSRSVISISAVFTGIGIRETLCPILYSLDKFPICFVENELIRRMIPTQPEEPIAAFIRTVNVNTMPGFPDTLQLSLQLVWFNSRPFLPRMRFRTKWFNLSTQKVREILAKEGSSDFRLKYGPTGVATNATIGNDYSERIEEALPLLHYMYEGYDEEISLFGLDQITPGYSLDPEQLASSGIDFVFPVFQPPMRVRTKSGENISIDETLTEAFSTPSTPYIAKPKAHSDANFIGGELAVSPAQRILNVASAGGPAPAPIKKARANVAEEPPGDTPDQRASDEYITYWRNHWCQKFDVDPATVETIMSIESGRQPRISNYKFLKVVTGRKKGHPNVKYRNVYAGTSAAGLMQTVYACYKSFSGGAPWIGPRNIGVGFRSYKDRKKRPYQYLSKAEAARNRGVKEFLHAKENLLGQFDPKNNLRAGIAFLANLRNRGTKKQQICKWVGKKGKKVRKCRLVGDGRPLWTKENPIWADVALAYHDGYGGMRSIKAGTADKLVAKRGKYYRKKFVQRFEKYQKKVSEEGTPIKPAAPKKKGEVGIPIQLAIAPGKVVDRVDKSDGRIVLDVYIRPNESPSVSDFVTHPSPMAWRVQYTLIANDNETLLRSRWGVKGSIGGSGVPSKGSIIRRGQDLGVAFEDFTGEAGRNYSNRAFIIAKVERPPNQAGVDKSYNVLPKYGSAKGKSKVPAAVPNVVKQDINEIEALRRSLRSRDPHLSRAEVDGYSKDELIKKAKEQMILDRMAEGRGGPQRLTRDPDKLPTELEGLTYLVENGWVIIKNKFTRKVAQHKNIHFSIPAIAGVTASISVSSENNGAITPMSGHTYPTVQFTGGRRRSATVNIVFSGSTGLQTSNPDGEDYNYGRQTIETFEALYQMYKTSAVQYREFSRAMPMMIGNELLNALNLEYFFIDGKTVETMGGRPFDLSLGLRLTGTKAQKEAKPRLIATGEDSADLVLVRILVNLLHHGYYSETATIHRGTTMPAMWSKADEELEEWWKDAQTGILGLDPTPNASEIEAALNVFPGLLKTDLAKKYLAGVAGTGGSLMYSLSSMNKIFTKPTLTVDSIKTAFKKLTGKTKPETGDAKHVRQAIIDAASKYKDPSDHIISVGKKIPTSTVAFRTYNEIYGKWYTDNAITWKECVTLARSHGFEPLASFQQVQSDRKVHYKLFLHLFTNWGGVPAVNRLKLSHAHKKELLSSAAYLGSSEAEALGAPGHEDFKAIIKGESKVKDEDPHPGMYPDLALPPSPISGRVLDTNPDAFFFNDSDVTRCNTDLYKVIHGTVSPLKEKIKEQETFIGENEEAMIDLYGEPYIKDAGNPFSAKRGSITQGGLVTDTSGNTFNLYNRPEHGHRSSKVNTAFVDANSYENPTDVVRFEDNVRTHKSSDRKLFPNRGSSYVMTDSTLTVAALHPVKSYRNGTSFLEYSVAESKNNLEHNDNNKSYRTESFNFARGTFLHNGNSDSVKGIVKGRNETKMADSALHQEISHRHDQRNSLHLLGKAIEHAKNDEMSLRRAFPTFQLLFVEEDTPSVFLTIAFDDFYDVNAVESINIVHNKDHPGSTCTIQLLDLDGALYNRRYELSEDQEARMGIHERQITVDGKKVPAPDLVDSSNRPFFSTMMKEGMKVIVKMGHTTNPADLDTVFVGQLASFNQGARTTLVCQSYGTELVAQRFGHDPSENVDMWNATAGDVIHTALNREEIRHFGRWKLEKTSPSGRIFGHDELRPDGRIYSHWSWMPTQSDDNIYFPEFSDSWGIWDKLWGHIQYVYYNTTVWEVLKEMELRIPGHVAYPVPYGNRMTLFFGNPNQQYMYRPASTNSERISALTADVAEDPTDTYKWLAGDDRFKNDYIVFHYDFNSPEARQSVFDNLKYMNKLRKTHKVNNVDDVEALVERGETLRYNGVDDVIDQMDEIYRYNSNSKIDHALKMSDRVDKLVELANKYGGVKSGKLPANIPQAEFWSVLRKDHEGRVRPFRNYIWCTDFNHLIMNNIKCSKEGTFNAIELKYTDSDDVDFEEFNDGEDVTTITVKADDGIKEHHIRKDTRSFPNANSTECAERYGSQLVANSLKDIYKGHLIMMGNPLLKPYDIIWMNDVYTGISGPVEVKEVIHSFSPSTGYTCEVSPHLIVNVSETITETLLGSTGRMFLDLFGDQSQRYTSAAGAINLEEKLITGAAADRVKRLGAGRVNGGNTFIYGRKQKDIKDAGMTSAAIGVATAGGVGTAGIAGAAIYFAPIMGPIGLAIACFGLYKYVNFSSTREPVHITPLMKNDKPYIIGVEGFENDSLMVATGKKWTYFVEGWEKGAEMASTALGNIMDEIFY